MDWEVPSPKALMENDLSKFVHFAASDYGFDGSIKALVINWLCPLVLAAKANSTNIDNPNRRRILGSVLCRSANSGEDEGLERCGERGKYECPLFHMGI